MATLGQELKEERERRAVSIKEISDQTKISSRILLAIENDLWEEIPGTFFLRGVIRSYAQTIGADPKIFLAKCDEQSGQKTKSAGFETGGTPYKKTLKPPADLIIKPPLFQAQRRLLRLFWIPLLLLIAAGAVVYRLLIRSGNDNLPKVDRPASFIPPPAILLPTLPDKPEPKPATQEKGLRLEFQFQADTWMHIASDGQVVLVGTQRAGSTINLKAEREFILQTGNAGGFSLILNGRPARSLGGLGVVLTDIRINASNLATFLKEEAPPNSNGFPRKASFLD